MMRRYRKGGIPRVIVLGYDGLPLQPVAPPSPDYIPGPENPQTPPVPQDEDERSLRSFRQNVPNTVPEPIYPEYIPLEDDHEFLAEEQPLPPIDSPTTESPGYVTESDPEEDPEEYEDDETEDGPVDDLSYGRRCLMEMMRTAIHLRMSNDEDETRRMRRTWRKEEHLAPGWTILPVTGRTPELHILPPEAEVERLLTMTTPSPSPPISLSSPSAGERLARMISPCLHHLPARGCISPLRSDYKIGESLLTRPTRGRGIDYRFVNMVYAEERRQGIRDVGYGIRDTWVNTTEDSSRDSTDDRGRGRTLGSLKPCGAHESDTSGLDDSPGDSIDGGGGGICFPRGLAHSIGLSQATYQELQTHRDHVDKRHATDVVSTAEQQRRAAAGPEASGPDHQDVLGDAGQYHF
ncbi:hypothetical protein Tco_0162465 [Tanacetum coccineum]